MYYALLRYHVVDLWMELFRIDGVWDHVMIEGTESTKTFNEAYKSIMWSINETEQGPVWPVARIFQSYEDAKRILKDEVKRGVDVQNYKYAIVTISAESEIIDF